MGVQEGKSFMAGNSPYVGEVGCYDHVEPWRDQLRSYRMFMFIDEKHD